MHTIAYPITFFVSEKLKYFEQKVKVNLAVFDLMSKQSSTSTSTRTEYSTSTKCFNTRVRVYQTQLSCSCSLIIIREKAVVICNVCALCTHIIDKGMDDNESILQVN